MRHTMSAVKLAVTLLVLGALVGCGVPKGKHAELQAQYTKMREDIASFNREVQKIRLENLDLKKQVKDLQTQVATLETDNKQSKALVEKLEEENKALKTQAGSGSEGAAEKTQ